MSAHSDPVSSALAQPQPSPQAFFETVNAYQRPSALKTAIELNLFTAIAEGKNTADALALRCQASPRGVRILADYLRSSGGGGRTAIGSHGGFRHIRQSPLSRIYGRRN
jgi:Dimerisation domain